jgi:hypothetical protein
MASSMANGGWRPPDPRRRSFAAGVTIDAFNALHATALDAHPTARRGNHALPCLEWLREGTRIFQQTAAPLFIPRRRSRLLLQRHPLDIELYRHPCAG